MQNKVLIIDDDELVARVIRRVLYDFKLEWMAAPSRFEACEIVAISWDLLILDAHLGAQSGFEILSEIKSLAPERFKAILVISGDPGFERAVKALGASFLKKPIDFEELRVAAESILSSKA